MPLRPEDATAPKRAPRTPLRPNAAHSPARSACPGRLIAWFPCGCVRSPGQLLDSSAVNRQLREMEKMLAKSSGEGGAGDAAKYQLKQLRKALLDDQLAQFDSQRVPIQQDMREAVLGRLTAPSQRLFDQLSFDPQVGRHIRSSSRHVRCSPSSRRLRAVTSATRQRC